MSITTHPLSTSRGKRFTRGKSVACEWQIGTCSLDQAEDCGSGRKQNIGNSCTARISIADLEDLNSCYIRGPQIVTGSINEYPSPVGECSLLQKVVITGPDPWIVKRKAQEHGA